MKEIDKIVDGLMPFMKSKYMTLEGKREKLEQALTTIYNKGIKQGMKTAYWKGKEAGKVDERERIANEIYEELLPVGSFDGFDLVKQIKGFYEKLLKQQ